MKFCYSCKAEINSIVNPTRSDTCSKCGAYLKVCRNCTFFNEALSNKCLETQAEYISEKEKSNFCEYFKFAEQKDKNNNSKTKNDFDKLFK